VNVSVVIRCFNEEKHIGRLLSGIMKQTVKDVDIVVMDSGSTDSTVSVAAQYPTRIVSIKPEEFSFGRSLNLGCQEAKGRFIVTASAHVYPVFSDWLEKLLTPFEDESVALVYGKQRGNESTKYSEHQVFAKWFPDGSNRHQDHPFCNNANAAIRRSVWHEQLYNEELTGLEDLDWAKRVMASGLKIAYAAEAEVVHVHNETLKQIYNRYRREAIAMKAIFPDQKFNLWDFLHLCSSNVIMDCYHALRDGMLTRNLGSIPLFRCMQFWGTYRGFRWRGRVTRKLKEKFYYPNGWRRPKDEWKIVEESRSAIEYESPQ
jgi:rhamnosyltransferase